jgi:G3E family GTPase
MTRARLDSVVTVIDADAFHATLCEVMHAHTANANAASPSSSSSSASASSASSSSDSSAASADVYAVHASVLMSDAWSPDAAQLAALRAHWPVAAWEQLHAADVVLLNKTDLLVCVRVCSFIV